MEEALKDYYEALRLNRILHEIPEPISETYWRLTEHIRRTGRWPNLKKATMKWNRETQDRKITLQYLRNLEKRGFLKLADRKTSLPITAMNEDQEYVYEALILACSNRRKTSATLEDVQENLLMHSETYSKQEVEQHLKALNERKLLRVRETKTESGEVYAYQLLPTVELAEEQVFNPWVEESWTADFLKLMES